MTNDTLPPDQLDRLRRALLAIERLQKKVDRLESAGRMPIALIGMGCRFPGADNPEALWRLLCAGKNVVREVPPDRWDIEAYYDPDPAAVGKMYTRVGGFIDRVDGFDAGFFGIAPREAVSMDPQQRLLLEVAWEALENAGLLPARLAGSATGVFLGIFSNDYYHLQMLAGNDSIDAYTGTGNTASVAAGRISYLLGLEGPNVAIDTACSSSLVAVHLACQSLRARESDLALAGGVNLILAPDRTIYFCKLQAMAPDGRCKSFDARADGYVRGEGCGIVVLKRLDDAVRDGDPIIAVIRGTAVNQDGRSSGLTAPNGPAQAAAIRKALAEARLEPARISYVEAHGTGTALGDPIEVGALAAALSLGRSADNPLAIGSIKTNMGHLEAAAGVAALIKVALMLQHRQIPPNLHFETPNPHIDWEAMPMQVPVSLAPWTVPEGERRVAGVNSFGLSGTNAHVILEEAPVALPVEAGQGPFLLPLSARSAEALRSLAQAYRTQLQSNVAQARDVCHSAGARRAHHEHRLALTGSTGQSLVDQLDAFLAGAQQRGVLSGYVPRGQRRKLVFVFAGQGGQWAGMGRTLLEREPVFRAALEECEQAMRPYLAHGLLDLLADPQAPWLAEIDQLQPVLFALQVGLAALWRAWGIVPDAVVGHSLGEIAAAYVAGALSLPDAARVICTRSRLLGRLRGQGAMALVELPAEAAVAEIGTVADRVALAAVNGPRSSVLAGDPAALGQVVARLEGQGVFCRWVKVDVAAHSPQVDPLRDELVMALRDHKPRSPVIPFYSTVTPAGEALPLDGNYWARNLRAPVRFWEAIQRLAADGHDVFLELSPHATLKHSIEETLKHAGCEGAALASLARDENETVSLYESAGALYTLGQPIDWAAMFAGSGFVEVPTYPWQRERFWFGTDSLQPGQQAHAQRSPVSGNGDRLPGRRLPSPLSEVQFETRLQAGMPAYLGDHRIRDVVVVPGAWYAAGGLAAAEQALGPGPYQLEQVYFPQALTLTNDAERLVHTILARDGAAGASFRLLSCGSSEDAQAEDWLLHADGRVQPSGTSAAERLDLSALRERCRIEITSEAFYERMWLRGYHFGPTFRTIGSIWRGDGEVLCQVSAASRDRHQSRVQLIDCCLQLPAAIFHGDDLETIYLPVGFDQLRCTEPTGGPIWGYAALRPGTDRGEGAVFDVYLLEETGRVLAALTGLQSKRAQSDRQAIAGGLNAEPATYEVCWRPAPRQGEKKLVGDEPGAWLILADQRGTGAALAGLLRARGERCIVVLPGANSETDDEAALWVDPTCPDEVARVLHEAIVANSPLRGVVHCWSLDVDRQATLDAIQTLVCDSVLSTVKALATVDTAWAPRLWLVTRGVQAITPQAVAVGQAPLWGLGRTIAYEHPELRCTLIDLDPDDLVVQELCDELCSDSQDDQVALRKGERFAARLALAAALPAAPNTRFDVTYLITGGLGALGLQVADWLVGHGTRHLALLSRSAPAEAATHAVDNLRSRGAQVLLLQADVADEEQLAAALNQVRQALPPLGGVVHAAGVLDDGLLLQLTPERVRRVLAPKVAGAWNLHALTRTDPIKTFILFSSASGLLGAPGQANYAAANAFLDALAHQRRAEGLPALSIDWGPWAEVGLAAAQSNRGQRLATRGVGGISTEAGLRALGRALGQDRPQVGILSFDLRQWQRHYPQAAGLSFLSEIARPEAGQQPEPDIRAQLLGRPAGRQRRLLLEDLLVERMCQVLRLNASQLDRRKPLGDLGFDSLMALELRNVLEASVHVQLSATLIWRYPSIAALTDHLAEKLGLVLDAPEIPEPEPRDDLERSASQIADLSDAEMEALLLRQIDRMTANQ